MSASCVSGTVAGASVLATPYLCHRTLDLSTSFPTFAPSVHGLKRSFTFTQGTPIHPFRFSSFSSPSPCSLGMLSTLYCS